MKIREIVLDTLIKTRLFEMAFERKAIIDKLRAFQPQINRHAFKIIIWPDAQEATHWKHELTVWGNDLAALTMRTGRGLRPMGFDLAWKHLYLEPFEGSESQSATFLVRALEQEYQRLVTKPLSQIMAEYMAFIRPFCQAIGSQQTVGEIVQALGQSAPAPRMEAAAK
jgi:hypothetical protein